MKTIKYTDIVNKTKELALEANFNLPKDVYNALLEAKEKETSPLGKSVIEIVLKNARVAKEEQLAICQDTGVVVVFAEIGQDVRIEGGLLADAINEGVRQAYEEGYLRKSVISDPVERINTADNTPAVIHFSLVEGDQLHLTLAPKGFGSENMSRLKMFKPTDDIELIKNFILDTVVEAGGNPCPPIIMGIGLGGTMEKAGLLAKKALFRKIGSKHPKKHLAELEEELLILINKTGVGPQGFGGSQTALAVFIEEFPTHIAGLPVAVNLNCHAARHAEAIL
ncbi:MAG: fumarate hydratase [Bacillota bacterium]|nr:fumarate hydratase [Bacillota bacterium]